MIEKLFQLEIELVLKIFERFSNWTQKLFGMDCLSWARLFQLLFAMNALWVIFDSWIEKRYWISIFDLILSLMFCFINAKTMQLVKEWYRVKPEGGVMSRNPFLILDSRSRRGFLAISIYFAIYGIFEKKLLPVSLYMFLLYIISAFLACTPLPPGKSKMRKLWEGAKESIRGAFAPDGAIPAPT